MIFFSAKKRKLGRTRTILKKMVNNEIGSAREEEEGSLLARGNFGLHTCLGRTCFIVRVDRMHHNEEPGSK